MGAAFLTGWLFSLRLYRRRDFLRNFLVFLNSVATHMRYDSENIFNLVSGSTQNAGLEYFEADNEPGQPFEKLWKNYSENLFKVYNLTKADKDLLFEFGTELGKTDVDGQLKHIELYKTQFSKQLSEAEDGIKQKSKLYKTMGFFVGASAVLLMF